MWRMVWRPEWSEGRYWRDGVESGGKEVKRVAESLRRGSGETVERVVLNNAFTTYYVQYKFG
jgi:hypothetical protein